MARGFLVIESLPPPPRKHTCPQKKTTWIPNWFVKCFMATLNAWTAFIFKSRSIYLERDAWIFPVRQNQVLVLRADVSLHWRTASSEWRTRLLSFTSVSEPYNTGSFASLIPRVFRFFSYSHSTWEPEKSIVSKCLRVYRRSCNINNCRWNPNGRGVALF